MPDFSISPQNDIQEWLLEYFDRDMTCIRDCANSGHGSGSCGNIYYEESTRFYQNYTAAIWQSLSDYASDIGQDIATFVGELISEEDVRDHKNFAAAMVGAATGYEAGRLISNLEYYKQQNPETDETEDVEVDEDDILDY